MTTTPAGWYPDPGGKYEHRYFDGARWTDHVSSHGHATIDPMTEGHVPTAGSGGEKVQAQVGKAGFSTTSHGGGTLFTESLLVVNQKRKLIEVNSEYAVFNQAGIQIGAVRQVGQSNLKKAIRFVGSVDQFMTHSFQIIDASGRVALTLKRPRKFLKSRLEVGDANGNAVGEIVQDNAIGKIRFSLNVDGRKVGSLNAENWRAWNFSIRDHHDVEVARITKTFEGVLTTLFTTADNYVLHITGQVDGPLRTLIVASALAVDTALKQDSRGLG